MNPNNLELNDLVVYGFCSHNPEKYPKDRRWFCYFSNWYMSTFVINNMVFNCVEQWMMYSKAMRYGDVETANLILKETQPATQKKLGRSVKNFDQNDWSKVCYSIVLQGVYAKFSQNNVLFEYLKNTKGKILAEASNYDKIWGIGLSPDDPATQNVDMWKGQNLLGKCLMEVRDSTTLVKEMKSKRPSWFIDKN